MSAELAGVLQLALGLVGWVGFAAWAHYFINAFVRHGDVIKDANAVLAEAEMVETWIDDYIPRASR